MYRLTKALFVLTIAAALLSGCGGTGIFSWLGTDESKDGTAPVSLSIVLPDYANHLFPDPNRVDSEVVTASMSRGAKVIAPDTHTVDVTISAPDISPAITAGFTLPRNVDPANGITGSGTDANGYHYWWEWRFDDGFGRVEVTVADVPIGMDRTISVVTKNQDGTILTTGTLETAMDLNDTDYHLYLEPASWTPISAGASASGSVEEGRMKYYRIELPGDGMDYLVWVHSDFHDVDLYAYRQDDPGWHGYSWFQGQPPVDEAVILRDWESRYYYLGVYGGSAGTASFTIGAEALEGQNFEYNVVVNIDPTTQPYASIEGASGTQELWLESPRRAPFQEIDLGFDFHYHGTPYRKIYVSPNGYVSFWKYRIYYHWWYYNWWADPNNTTYWWEEVDWDTDYWYNSYFYSAPNGFWWGWHWFYKGIGRDLPNETVNLYKAPLFFMDSNTGTPGIDSKVLFKRQTTTKADGTVLEQLVLEYKDLYHRYDDTDAAKNRYLSGQIVFTEADPNFAVQEGTVEFRYDRVNSDMYQVPGYIGLENDSGEQQIGPGSVGRIGDSYEGIPADDLLFTPDVGGFDMVVQ